MAWNFFGFVEFLAEFAEFIKKFTRKFNTRNAKIKAKIQAFAKKREFVDCHDLTSSNLAMTA